MASSSSTDAYQPLFRRRLQLNRNAVNVYQPHALNEELKAFFGLPEPELVRYTKTFPVREVPQIHFGLRSTFPAAREEFRAGSSGRCDGPWIPSESSFEVRPGRYQTFLTTGTLFSALPTGRRVVFSFTQDKCPINPECEFSIIGPCRDDLLLKAEFEQVVNWTKRDHYLFGQAIRADGVLLNVGDVVWSDVALSRQVRTSLEENIVQVLALRAKFEEIGIPQKRGILLSGPPGTGKTMIGKVLAGLGIASFILFTAGDLERYDSIRAAFDLARQLRPTILFIEDLDLIAVNRSSRFDSGVLGELLAQLDGIEQNDGLIVVATTNDLAAIEPAIAERPSRFDVVLEIGLPGLEERRWILQKHIGRLVGPATLDEIVSQTDGYSGAQVQEIAYQFIHELLLNQHRRSDAGDANNRSLQQKVIAGVAKRRSRVGFVA